MPSPFPCSPVICECSWKENLHRKKQNTKNISTLQKSKAIEQKQKMYYTHDA